MSGVETLMHTSNLAVLGFNTLGFCVETKPAVHFSSGRFPTVRSLISELFIWVFFFLLNENP